MNMSFYTAAVGATQQQNRLNVTGNNIANVNTYGYKADQSNFASLMYGNVNGIDNAQLPRGTGARLIGTTTNFAQGAMADTGHRYDYAINSADGFFALYDPQNGEISYTRDGSFTMSQYERIDDEGEPYTAYMLSDGLGRFVFGESGTLIEIDTENPEAKQPVGVFAFENTDGMRLVGDNRFVPVEKNGAPRLLEGADVTQGYLEASNVDLAEELTKVIEAQRSYSYVLRMVTTSDEIETTINGLRG